MPQGDARRDVHQQSLNVKFMLAFSNIILTFEFLYENPINLNLKNRKGCLNLKKKISLTQALDMEKFISYVCVVVVVIINTINSIIH